MSEFWHNSEFEEVKINDHTSSCQSQEYYSCQSMADFQPSFGREPIQMICPYCSEEMWTKVESKPSVYYGWIAGIALACVR